MGDVSRPAPVTYCDDSELGYLRDRTDFRANTTFGFDDAYRLTHLPLVAPDHPLVIPSREGTDYHLGKRTKRIFSMVLPVPVDALLASRAYERLDSEIRASAFAAKIAWDIEEKRRPRLHATVCSSMSLGVQPEISSSVRKKIAELGPLHVKLRGIFSGAKNTGRLYLRIYPERRSGENTIQVIQREIGSPKTDLYLVGLYNLRDTLTESETAASSECIGRWWDTPLLNYQVDHLVLMGSRDNLMLDSEVVERIGLT